MNEPHSTCLDFDLLRGLTHTPALPGREAALARLIQSELPEEGWQTRLDGVGNLIATRPGGGKHVLFAAHMDEVGLLVRRITPQGFLLVERLGGMSMHALEGSRLSLWTESGELDVQVGLLPEHLWTPAAADVRSLYLDVGARSAQEAAAMGIQVGDGLTWSSPLQRLGAHFVSGKALDDRLGCYLLLRLARLWQAVPPGCTLSLAFVVQEETSEMGSLPVMQTIAPDFVIGVDCTLAFDTPDLEGRQSDVRLGKGAALKWLDTIPGKPVFVPNLELARRIRSVARAQNIPLQDEVVTGIINALMPLPFAGRGVPCAALSIPLRYHHSPVEVAHVQDVENTLALLRCLIDEI